MLCEICGHETEVFIQPPGTVIDIATEEVNAEPIEVHGCRRHPHNACKSYVWGTMGACSAKEEPVIVIDSLSNIVAPDTISPQRLGAGGSGCNYVSGITKRNVEKDGEPMKGPNNAVALSLMSGLLMSADHGRAAWPGEKPKDQAPNAAQNMRKNKQASKSRKKNRKK